MRSSTCAVVCAFVFACGAEDGSNDSNDGGGGSGAGSAGVGGAGTAGAGGTGGSAGVAGTATGGTGAISADGNVTGTFDGTTLTFTENVGASYYVSESETRVVAQLRGRTPDEDKSVYLRFPGNATGSFACGDDFSTAISFGQNMNTYSSTSSAVVTPCSIGVVEYQAVGQRVRGTFSGTLVATVVASDDPVEVTAGTFDVVRLPDR